MQAMRWRARRAQTALTETIQVLTPLTQILKQQTSSSTTNIHLKRELSKAPLVFTKVRRSERIKSKLDDFKVPPIRVRF
jgi:hypothetical protein